MADNTVLNSGSGGDTIATDDIGGTKHQRVKVQHGADGSATDVSAASPLPVDGSGVTQPVSGTVTETNSTAILADTAAMDTNLATVAGAVSTEDAAHSSGATGIMPLTVRQDTQSALTSNDGDFSPVTTDANGSVYVNPGSVSIGQVVPGTGATDLGKAEDAAHASGDVGVQALFVRQDTQSNFAADGGYTPGSVDANGALRVNAINADGTSNADTVAGQTDAGAVVLAIRDDALSTLPQAELDYAHLRVNSTGALHVTGGGGGTEYNIDDAAPTVVTLAGTIRDDALSTLPEADGDASALRVNSQGALHVTGGGGGTEYTEGDTDATITGGAMMMEVAGDALEPLQGTVADGLLVNLGSNNDVSVSGTVTVDGSGVTQPVSGTVTANLSATDNAVLDNIQTAVEIIDNAVSGSEMQVDVVGALPAGSNNIGDVDVATLPALPAGTNNIGDVDVASIAAGANLVGDVGLSGARTSGGATFFNSNDLDETEEQVKGSAGQIYFITCFNVSAALLYLQVFNNTAASVTVGTTAPDMVFPIPTQGDTNGAGFVLAVPNGIEMGTGITVAATTTPTGNTGPGANEVLINIGYA